MKCRMALVTLTVVAGLAVLPAFVPATAQAKTYLLTSQTSYMMSDGSWQKSWAETNTYDKAGRQKASTYKDWWDGKLQSSNSTKYTLDKKGRTKTVKRYENGKLTETGKYSYSSKTTTVKNYSAKGKYTGKDVMTSSKNKSVYKTYNAKNKLQERTVVKFKNGTVTSSIGYDAKGKVTHKYTATLKKGKVSKGVSISYSDGKKYTYTTEYSYSGKYTTEKSYDGGVLSSVTKYYTDKAGKRVNVSSKMYDSQGKKTSATTYKADKYTSGKLKGVVKRVTSTDADGNATGKTEYSYKVL